MTGRMNIVAIDGPGGSGKSTVAKRLAERLGFLYIDTGAMYRALTLKAIKKKVNLRDSQALSRLLINSKIRLSGRRKVLKVYLDGKDVTREIRKPSVTKKVFFIARIPEVRREMVKLQRRFASKSKGAVLEGRDIGTVVFPKAKHKFYLDASFKERARRRHKELKQSKDRHSLRSVEKDLKKRDHLDRTRKVAPLKRAKDAVYLDTSDLNIEQATEALLAQIDN